MTTVTDTITEIRREIPFELRANDGSDGLTLEGYAAVFNSPTVIRGERPAVFVEEIAPGAFTKAVRRNPPPILQFDHGTHPMLGSIPIGALTSMREDERGLHVKARIHDNWLTHPVRDAIASKAISGMSFRFVVAEDGETWDYSQDTPVRTLTDVDVLELGPVVWPAYRDTQVSVRSDSTLVALIEREDLRRELAQILTFGTVRPDPDMSPSEDSDRDIEPEPTVEPAPTPGRHDNSRLLVRAAAARMDVVLADAIDRSPLYGSEQVSLD